MALKTQGLLDRLTGTRRPEAERIADPWVSTYLQAGGATKA